MPRDRARKLTDRRHFRDVSHMKLADIFKSLRKRKIRRDVSQRTCFTRSRSSPVPLADFDSSPVQPFSSNVAASPSARYRPDAVSILSATEEDCSSRMSIPSSGLEWPPCNTERSRHLSFAPTLPTSPTVFQLRSVSTRDYLVDRLEQHLRQLSLGDANVAHLAVQGSSSYDILIADRESHPHHALSDVDTQKPPSPPDDQNVVPMILITSVDAKQAKPLPPSSQRPSRTPFSSFNLVNHPTNTHTAILKSNMPTDDPFTTQSHNSTYPPDFNLTFRLPSFPSAYLSPSKYAPETPTPMCCDHFGDCRGDLWEVLHPPLVASKFTLPPFQLPPMSSGIFDDSPTPLPTG